MSWVEKLVERLVPVIGGIPTFVEDPDHLLDIAPVREMLRQRGMTLSDWDGLPASLHRLKHLPANEMPLLIVGKEGQRHLVVANLKDFRWETVSRGALMPRFPLEIVQSFPADEWDDLCALHEQVRHSLSKQEATLLIARQIYGLDVEAISTEQGWLRFIANAAHCELPQVLSSVLAQYVPDDWPEFAEPNAFTDTTYVRSVLRDRLKADSGLYDRARRPDQLLLADFAERDRYGKEHRESVPKFQEHPTIDFMPLWDTASRTPQDVLQFGMKYASAISQGIVPDAQKSALNRQFATWLQQHYGVIQSTSNSAVLRLPTLLRFLDAETAERPLMLVVIDGLSLVAWAHLRGILLQRNIAREVYDRAAYAVLPTITSISRRALFEGRLPSQFSSEPHSQALERKLWSQRFVDGEYFGAGEGTGVQDAIARGKQRICVLDVSWDRRCHAVDRRTDSIKTAMEEWAIRTPLWELMQVAHLAGYRVIITSDHGQTECTGHGKPNIGVLSTERSKRVVLFDNKTVCDNAMNTMNVPNHWADNYRPMGLPADMYPLFASEFYSFDIRDAECVSHGGLSLEEVLVPVAEILR